MTTTSTTTSTVDRFLQAVADGRTDELEELYTPGAHLDATVPNWRFRVDGAAAIAAQYASWFDHPGQFEEVCRRPFVGGETVSYLRTWEEGGVPHAGHHCHVLTFGADGRIAHDQVWCGGRWDAGLLAEMGAADDAG